MLFRDTVRIKLRIPLNFLYRTWRQYTADNIFAYNIVAFRPIPSVARLAISVRTYLNCNSQVWQICNNISLTRSVKYNRFGPNSAVLTARYLKHSYFRPHRAVQIDNRTHIQCIFACRRFTKIRENHLLVGVICFSCRKSGKNDKNFFIARVLFFAREPLRKLWTAIDRRVSVRGRSIVASNTREFRRYYCLRIIL